LLVPSPVRLRGCPLSCPLRKGRDQGAGRTLSLEPGTPLPRSTSVPDAKSLFRSHRRESCRGIHRQSVDSGTRGWMRQAACSRELRAVSLHRVNSASGLRVGNGRCAFARVGRPESWIATASRRRGSPHRG
jgi:hypothetical protein